MEFTDAHDQRDIVPRLRQAADHTPDLETRDLMREAARTIELLPEYAQRVEVRELAEMAAAGSA